MMNWKDHLKADSLPWLLEESEPGVRFLALRDLAGLPETDPVLVKARHAAHEKGPIALILNEMHPDGYWIEPGPGYNPKYRSLVWSLILLASLGARVEENQRIQIAINYCLDHCLAPGGQFASATAPGGTADCLQGNLCWALTEMGSTDTRLDKAYDWMARTVIGEGIAAPGDKSTTQRYYAGKCGPNFACGANDKKSCAWGAGRVMQAFSVLPRVKRTAVIDRAITHGIEFFLKEDPATVPWPNGYAPKPSGNWWKFGFPVFYITDLLLVAEVLTNLDRSGDPRMKNLFRLILDKQDDQGRWMLENDYAGKTWGEWGEKKKPNKWVTLRALRVIKHMQ
ncbi:MAG: hypothetical protein JXR32_08560 [Anaerolineaceae bacterium]|nr:hypothetical protein [Anaerolineaceae bacterium]